MESVERMKVLFQFGQECLRTDQSVPMMCGPDAVKVQGSFRFLNGCHWRYHQPIDTLVIHTPNTVKLSAQTQAALIAEMDEAVTRLPPTQEDWEHTTIAVLMQSLDNRIGKLLTGR